MAVVTASVIGIGTSLYKTGSAIAEGNKAQDAIDAFKPQDLRNPYADLAIDTTAADQQTAANISNVASSIDAVQRTGSRGVAAAVPRLTESSAIIQDRISADLTKQSQRRDELIARGEDKIQDLQEQREREILAGLGQRLNVARQDLITGATGVVSNTLALGSALGTPAQTGVPRPAATTASSLTSAGLSTDYIQPASNLTPAGFQNVGTGLPTIPGINPLLQNTF
ncbi:virion structural protein [Tenacibaculum phage Gundel_1]|uniref:Structural protein n=1 Tax=Tenacibaculum phage Gundel_1 TaxID=2745672 RepID=A0A8E5EA47_9CAUD|nr:virion structural protein [Tenacibaculum phage Gundel_1]QQV91508.1 structural protein [Tenacibaculum phage Gundel_1]